MSGPQQDPHIEHRIVFGGVTFFVVLVAAGIGIGLWLARWRPNGPMGPPAAAPGRPPDFGYVEQALFIAPADGGDLDQLAGDQLRSYGWVDVEHQVAHVPIARAKALLLAAGGAR